MEIALENKTKVLALTLEKEFTDTAFFDFEKHVIFGVLEVLKHYSNVELCDYAIPANRLMFKRRMSPDSQAHELRHLAANYDCRYVLYGEMRPKVTSNDTIHHIDFDLALFDAETDEHRFQLVFPFSNFAPDRNQISTFVAHWDGVQEMIIWLACQIMGTVQPTSLVNFAQRVINVSLAPSYKQYEYLTNAFYLGNESEKEIQLVKLAEAAPDWLLVNYELGNCFKRQGKYDHAAKAYSRCWPLMGNIHPRQKATMATDIGICYALNEKKPEAMNWWKRAIETDKTYLNPYMNLAFALEEVGKMNEAEAVFRKAGEVDPTDTRVYSNLARLYVKMENWENAITQYQQALMLEPADPWAHSDLANCYLQKGDLSHAIKYLRRTLELDPEGEAGRCAGMILSGLEAVESN